ncbi:CotH kinase family protein [Mucilaginibacter corticis]|nr:CotH kinase family protein [Mucilaginibacter corticis]
MKKFYSFCVPIFLLASIFAGCKKNTVNKPTTGSSAGKGAEGKTNPVVPITSEAKLSNFKINGVSCAFDSLTNSYYYPLSSGTSLTNYTVSFDTTQAVAITINNARITNGASVNYELKTNQQVDVYALNSLNVTTKYGLIITGMPMVNLKTNAAIGDNEISASFDLVDPDYQLQKSKLDISSNIMIALRGATSRYYPKSSYAVHVVDNGGNDKDVSLLGLRNDNSWILDAMYIDQSRMRNRVCTDLWNTFNNVPYIAKEPTALNGTHGYMTEVFLNNKYQGIYCLTEKVDRKQLQINKQYGNMYKADFWTNQSDFTSVIPYDNTIDTWGGWELEYPDIGDVPAPNWGYLYNEVNYIATSSDADFSANIQSKVDINNMVDYFIFINVLGAPDNENKNTYFSFYDYRDAGAFFYSPWDLDGTFGRNANGGYYSNQLTYGFNNNLLSRLLQLNVANFKGLLKTRWAALKQNQLSKTTVNARIENYRNIMVTTNAFAREQLIWTNISQDLNTEAVYMDTWYSAQYDLFDNYINDL